MFWRYLVATTGLITVLSGVFAGLAWLTGKTLTVQLPLIEYSGGVGLLAAAVGMAPLALVLPHGDQGACALACLAGGTLRFLMTLIATYPINVFLIDRSQSTCFYLWSTAFYLCVLMWETAAFVFIIRQRSNGSIHATQSEILNADSDHVHSGF